MKNFIFLNIILLLFSSQISVSQKIPFIKKPEAKSTGAFKTTINLKDDVLNKENSFPGNSYSMYEEIISDFNKNNNFLNRENSQENNLYNIRNNISFGGFINDYAVINYKPEMSASPAGFITVYAFHNIMSLIPVKELNQFYRTAAIQSAVFFIIDNSVNVFLYKGNWLNEIAGFTLKNIMMNLFLLSDVRKRNRNFIPWINDEYYYYSVSIKF